jgi:hypothetical protein
MHDSTNTEEKGLVGFEFLISVVDWSKTVDKKRRNYFTAVAVSCVV